MKGLGVFIVLVALSSGSAAAENTNVSAQCTKQPGMIGDAIIGTADTARAIYLSVVKQRGDRVLSENDIIVKDDGDHWTVYQYSKSTEEPKSTSAKAEITVVVHGGGTLEMEIDKCTGAIRAHHSK